MKMVLNAFRITSAVLLTVAASMIFAKEVKPNISADLVQRYRDDCLSSHTSCIIAERTYISKTEVKSNIERYFLLNNRQSVDSYNDWLRRLRDGESTAVVHFNGAEVFNWNKKSWSRVSGEDGCIYCYGGGALVTPEHPALVRIRFSDDIRVRDDTYLSISQVLTRNDHVNLYLIAIGSHGLPIYASIRSHGVHNLFSTVTSRDGYIRINLNSTDVMADQPDYFVISPYESWRNVASIYKQKEVKLASSRVSLPQYSGNNLSKIIDVVKFIKSINWVGAKNVTSFFPWQTVDDVLSTKTTDCKGLVTLFQAMLLRSGISSHVVSLNAFGMPPLSFQVPSNWANHVIVYIPEIDKYVDITGVVFDRKEWIKSADQFVGEVALDIDTGKFVVI